MFELVDRSILLVIGVIMIGGGVIQVARMFPELKTILLVIYGIIISATVLYILKSS